MLAQPTDSSAATRISPMFVLGSNIALIVTRISPGHSIQDRSSISRGIHVVAEIIMDLLSAQVINKSAIVSHSDAFQSLVESDVIAANTENLIKEYRTKVLTWRDFDDTVFMNFDTYRISTSAFYPFKRQKSANNNTLLSEEEVSLSWSEIMPVEPKDKIDSPFGNHNDSLLPIAGPFDFPVKPAQDEEEGVYMVKFPHYAKMCPYPHDRVAKVPVVQAVSMIQWIERVFLSSRSSMEYMKDLLKGDLSAMYKFEEHAQIIHGMCDELVEKLAPQLFDPEDRCTPMLRHKEWHAENRKAFLDSIIRTQYQLVQELLLSEKAAHKDANVLALYANHIFQKAVLTLSAELNAFVHNISHITTPLIHKVFGASYLESWKLITAVLNIVTSMPSPLRQHLRDLEQSIVRSKAFTEDSDFSQHLAATRLINPVILSVKL